MPVRSLTAVLLAAALIAAGCGEGENEEDEVRATLNAFAEATAKKDYQRLCDDLFSTALVEQVRRSVPCELALRNSSLGDARDPKLEIQRVTVEGDTASAVVTSSAANQQPSRDTVRLVREEDGWRIQALSS